MPTANAGTGDHKNVKSISIVFWNLRNILNKIDNFKTTTEDTTHKVYSITETWLKLNVDDTLLFKKGFNLFRSDR